MELHEEKDSGRGALFSAFLSADIRVEDICWSHLRMGREFKEQVGMLKQSMQELNHYCVSIGTDKLHFQAIAMALDDPDPFVSYKAFLIAMALMGEQLHTH